MCVGELHEFARPITISKKALDIKTFVEDSLKLVERQASEKNIQLQTSFTPDINKVLFDPDKMNQVLLNLYLNAIESMQEKGGSLSVNLAADKDKNQIEVQIADTGNGRQDIDLLKFGQGLVDGRLRLLRF